jgi:hypothetical protein
VATALTGGFYLSFVDLLVGLGYRFEKMEEMGRRIFDG